MNTLLLPSPADAGGTDPDDMSPDDLLTEVYRLRDALELVKDDLRDSENEREELTYDLDDLDKTARTAGFSSAADALDQLAAADRRSGLLALEEHHDAHHRGPLRFCSDALCASVVAA